MYKLYIVDDEQYVIDGLIRCIPWEKHGIELAGSSNDGTSAYRDILDLVPDIVITDIKMPGMDGIELIKKVHEQFPHIEFIIFSGYNDFYYARQAILSDAVDFLVKPSSLEEILTAVSHAVTKTANHSNVIRRIGHSSPDYRRLLESVFFNSATEICTPNYYYVILLVTFDSAAITYKQNDLCFEQNAKTIHLSFLDILEQHLVVLETDKLLEESDWTFLNEQIRDNLNIYFLTPEDTLMLAASNPHKLHNLRTAYKETTDSGEYCKWLSLKYARYDSIQYTDVNISDLSFWTELQSAVDQKALDDIELILNDVFEYFHKTHISRDSLKQFCIKAYLEIGNNPEKEGEMNLLLEISSLSSIANAYTYMLNIYRTHFVQAAENENDYKKRLIQKTMKFVQENYQKPISLNDAAAHVKKSPAYLSNKFKRETGIAFTQYVTDCRILAAKKLLISTNMKIKDIAIEVGFTDEQYFSLVFKRECGITAGGYRKIYYNL